MNSAGSPNNQSTPDNNCHTSNMESRGWYRIAISTNPLNQPAPQSSWPLQHSLCTNHMEIVVGGVGIGPPAWLSPGGVCQHAHGAERHHRAPLAAAGQHTGHLGALVTDTTIATHMLSDPIPCMVWQNVCMIDAVPRFVCGPACVLFVCRFSG